MLATKGERIVSVKITGLDDLMKRLDGMSKAASAPETARRMRQLRCPDHHVGPTNVHVVGNEARAEFCCEKFRKMTVADTVDAIFG